jgi:hypothetical protein
MYSASPLSIAVALITLGSSPAAAEETVCRGPLGTSTVDKLRVAAGADCTLDGTRVQGTVKVERDATLRASRIHVIGDVQAEGARFVEVGSSAIGGNVQLEQGRRARVVSSLIDGDLQLESKSPLARGVAEPDRRQPAGVPEHWVGHQGESHRRQLAMQGERSSPDGPREHRAGNKEDRCSGL